MHDGRCWYLTCFRKIHFDAAKASSSNSNVQLQLFTTKGGVRGYTLHSWDAECIDTMTPSVQASERAERNNNIYTPPCLCLPEGWWKSHVLFLLSPTICGLNVTLREASGGGGEIKCVINPGPETAAAPAPRYSNRYNVYFVFCAAMVEWYQPGVFDALIALIRRAKIK